MIIKKEDYLAHYGILRKSGRYPWGSGENPYQDNKNFLGYVSDLRAQGIEDKVIAQGLGTTTTKLRAALSNARQANKQADIIMATRLRAKGMSNVAIGKQMGIPEPTIRDMLKPGQLEKTKILDATVDMLERQVAEKKFIDVGAGAHFYTPGLSETKLRNAVHRLQDKGYEVHRVKVEQLGTGNMTEMKVLTPPGTKWIDVQKNRDQINQIAEFTEDGGRSYQKIRPPTSIDSKRVAVRYAEQGGRDADGVIFVRPGVDDVSLGKSRYAQVRIAVDGTHYLKGMAMYMDDLPEGVDLMFNTNKSDTGNKLDAMKPMKRDENGKIDKKNPFGSAIKPGGQRGVHNIVNEEGDWFEWNRNLPSQMLSKQSPNLAKRQLDIAHTQQRRELDEILSLTNPAVRRKLLQSYSDGADSAAVHLKAAAFPRQETRVILPLTKIKETEIYAPNFVNGERVALVRFPHGGIFEIPELRVNNKNPQGRKLLGPGTRDAVGIHPRVAERLSGADFDGDTVLVIPNNDGKIKSSRPLEKLKGFDPQAAYPPYDGMKTMDGGTWNAAKRKIEYAEGQKPSSRTKGFEMGNVSNLITDMTIRGASHDELARAVRHSMVVIDAEKHALNWKQSAIDNGISSLKQKYQGGTNEGASTLISRASSRLDVRERKPRPADEGGAIDPTTGKKVYVPTNRSWVDEKGKTHYRTERSTKLAETDDAHTLSSGKPIESIYADYSNSIKSLANEARRELVRTKSTPYSPSAKLAYAKEVEQLNAKLNLALRNAPRERQAQVIANAQVRQKRNANPDMDKDELKKLKSRALIEARIRVGAERSQIEITDSEWDAIQAGAITNHKLEQILANANLERVKELATPRSKPAISVAQLTRARAMLDAGHDQGEVARALGISLSTLQKSLSE